MTSKLAGTKQNGLFVNTGDPADVGRFSFANIDKKLFHTIYSSIDIRNSTCLGYNFLRSAPKKEHNFEEFSMPGSRLGEYFSVINFGESHGRLSVV